MSATDDPACHLSGLSESRSGDCRTGSRFHFGDSEYSCAGAVFKAAKGAGLAVPFPHVSRGVFGLLSYVSRGVSSFSPTSPNQNTTFSGLGLRLRTRIPFLSDKNTSRGENTNFSRHVLPGVESSSSPVCLVAGLCLSTPDVSWPVSYFCGYVYGYASNDYDFVYGNVCLYDCHDVHDCRYVYGYAYFTDSDFVHGCVCFCGCLFLRPGLRLR